MGLVSSGFDRATKCECSWIASHDGFSSPWAHFAYRTYGDGFAATGVASSAALPRLLKRRMHDWGVVGFRVCVGPDFISYGRELESLSQPGTTLFHGVDIHFWSEQTSSWFSHCHPREWTLRLHKAFLEPLGDLPAAAAADPLMSAGTRWPGQPRYLVDEVDKEAQHRCASDEQVLQTDPVNEPNPETIKQQLVVFLGNADDHIGMLCLPVPEAEIQTVQSVVDKWSHEYESPYVASSQRARTGSEFNALRATALNMPDLLLLGLEAEVAAALTPDWTWEKYPRGLGEVVLKAMDVETESTEFATIDGQEVVPTEQQPPEVNAQATNCCLQ